jgi:hypothetical protein
MYTSIKMVIPILPHFLKNAMFIFWRICRRSIYVPNATSTPPGGSPQRINCEAVTAGTVFFPLETLHRKSGLQFAVLTRSAGILPGDVVSLYFGCVRLNYPAYLAGSILGHAPGWLPPRSWADRYPTQGRRAFGGHGLRRCRGALLLPGLRAGGEES